MANLTPTPGWDEVFQLETDTPVLGGAGGVANSQAQALLNRVEFLKLNTANQFQDYAALRAHTGDAKTAYITGVLATAQPQGIAGFFQYDETDVTSADNGGTIIVGADGRRWKRVFDGEVYADWFGAVNSLAVDSTASIQSAFNYGLKVGKRVGFAGLDYKVSDTIYLLNTNYVRSFGFFGQSGNSTRIYFENSSVLKDMFYVDSDVNYLEISDLEFIDTTARTSRCFYFFDNRDTSAPAWKHLFRNVRITNFKEAGVFDGGITIADDAHCSEVMFIHSKCRNCETGLIYNNTQAVNHQLIGMDFENDAEGVSDEWTHILMKRGTTINHVGGSVIGKGSYLKYKYSEAGGFQDTSQFASKGVRVEKRGGAAPIIDHDTSSTLTLSNSLRIIIDDMPISVSGGSTVFARFGGRTFAKFSNVHSNAQLDVEAYMTVNLGASGLYGSIVMEDVQNLNYKRVSTVAAYGSAGVASTNYRGIPAQISYKNEGEQFTIDGGGYVVPSKPLQSVYSGSWEVAQLKTLVLVNADNTGFGSGANPATAFITLPRFGRPCKFRLLRDDVNAGSPFVLDLYVVVSGVDYLVASITPTVNVGGHFEADIQTATGLTNFLNDGVNWDGRMKIIKSGTVNGYVGLMMIDYM